jgi:carboxyl-terminal processing protease
MLLNRRHRVLLFAVMALASVAPPVLQAGDRDVRLASADAQELWKKGSDQVLAGDFSNAMDTLERVQRLEPGHSEVASAIGWLRDARTLSENREKLRVEFYQHWVDAAMKAVTEARAWQARPESEKAEIRTRSKARRESAKKTITPEVSKDEDSDAKDDTADAKDEKEEDEDQSYKWSRALSDAQLAMANAKDEDAFRKEPWLKEIVSNALLEIERHKENREWRDATVLYGMLQGIYPKNKDYQDGLEYTNKRAKLDIVYGPKTNWRSDLREVSATSISQLLERIDDDYVNTPDFTKLCADGLDHLLILAGAESISSTFPTLGDKDLVDTFVTRVNALSKKRIKGKSLSARQVRSIFETVLKVNEESLRLPESVMVDEFVAGMMEHLDEFTSVIWPAEVDDFNKHTRGDFVGVGIQITQDTGKPVRVESPLEDSPAYKANIKPGDFITHVDGKSTIEMTINQAVSSITGEPGSKVVLTIEDGVTKEHREIPLVREHIILRTVRGDSRDESRATGWNYFVDKDSKIGYVRVSGFMEKTVDDLKGALEQLKDEGCRGLILDLRFNPGGLLTSAVKMCELFLRESEPIVQTKGRSRQQNMEIRARSEPYFDRPLIILVNEYSASASEIVAGALSGLQEACVVGVRTYGKGSVQNLIPIIDNQAYLKLTTAHYFVYDKNRSGDPWYCLHREKDSETWGVEPHVSVKMIPSEITKILRLRRERDLLRGKDQAAIPKEVLERKPSSQPEEKLPEDPDPNVDPQLTAALNIMRLKLMSNQPWVMAPRHIERTAIRTGENAEMKTATPR